MIRPLLFTALALSSLSVPALAQSLTDIRTPPVERLRPLATEEGLQRLALANLIATNCEIGGAFAGRCGTDCRQRPGGCKTDGTVDRSVFSKLHRPRALAFRRVRSLSA